MDYLDLHFYTVMMNICMLVMSEYLYVGCVIRRNNIYIASQYTIQFFDLKTRIRKEIYDITHQCSTQIFLKEIDDSFHLKNFIRNDERLVNYDCCQELENIIRTMPN